MPKDPGLADIKTNNQTSSDKPILTQPDHPHIQLFIDAQKRKASDSVALQTTLRFVIVGGTKGSLH